MAQTLPKEAQKNSFMLKQLYFWSFIAFGAISPFEGFFYKRVLIDHEGVTATKLIGLIFFFTPLVGFISNMVAAFLSDTFKRGGTVLALLAGAAAMGGISIGIVGESFFMNLSLTTRFIWLFLVVLLYTAAITPINSLMDAQTMTFLSKWSDRSAYGKYRVWGTIGWAVSTLGIGYILNVWFHVPLIFYIGAISYLTFAIIAFLSKGEGEVKKVSIPWHHLKKNRSYFIFLLFVFLVAIVNNATYRYTSIFFDDVMETPLQMGLIFSFWTTLEIIIMHYSNWFMKKFGAYKLMVMGLFLLGLKYWVFSLFTLETPFIIKFLATVIIHGPAFAFHHLALMDLVDRQAHGDMKATYMSITTIVRSTIAGAIGGGLGGVVIDAFDGSTFMRLSGIALFAMIIFFLSIRKFMKNEKNT